MSERVCKLCGEREYLDGGAWTCACNDDPV